MSDATTTMVPADPNERLALACENLQRGGHAETYVEIADALGISDSYLNNMRHGRKTLSEDHWGVISDKLKDAYGLTAAELLAPPSESEGEGEGAEEAGDAGDDTGADGDPEPTAVEAMEPAAADEDLLRDDRIAVSHGDLHFHATRREDGRWDVYGRVEDDEIVRILAMSAYRDLFGARALSENAEEGS